MSHRILRAALLGVCVVPRAAGPDDRQARLGTAHVSPFVRAHLPGAGGGTGVAVPWSLKLTAMSSARTGNRYCRTLAAATNPGIGVSRRGAFVRDSQCFAFPCPVSREQGRKDGDHRYASRREPSRVAPACMHACKLVQVSYAWDAKPQWLSSALAFPGRQRLFQRQVFGRATA